MINFTNPNSDIQMRDCNDEDNTNIIIIIIKY